MIGALLFGLLTWMQPGHGLYHEKSAFWIEPPKPYSNQKGYFGFSVTYEPQSKNIIASAPQEDNIGVIYYCQPGTNNCNTVPRNVTREHPIYKHNYWLGAVVKAGDGFFVTCAPLYVETQPYEETDKTHYFGTFSKCYNYSNLSENPVQLQPIEKDAKKSLTKKFEHTMDSFGWSIDVNHDDTIIGSPAMFTGRVMMYHKTNMMHTNSKRDGNPNIQYNLGYSVVIGRFRNTGNKFFTYAVGSPYGVNGTGAIAFYSLDPAQDWRDIKFLGVLKNTKDKNIVGSMFGATLCAAQYYPRSQHMLLVGAPTYAPENTYNKGAVFFYEKGTPPLLPFLRKIEGRTSDSYFGSAIVSVGDLNGDKRDEIAIAAPYEKHGSTEKSTSYGVVYLYSSADIVNKQLDHVQPVQTIVAEAQSFGLSMTPLQNHYGKGCNELAIGAPNSNKLRVLQCVPAIVVEITDLVIIEETETSSQLTTEFCLNVKYPNKELVAKKNIDVQVALDHPNVTFVDAADAFSKVLIEKREPQFCKKIKLNIPKGGNYNQRITYKLTVIEPQSEKVMEKERLEVHDVIISDNSKLVSSGSLWLTKCKDQSNCVPDLKYLGITWMREDETNITGPYLIGSSKEISVNIIFGNYGEVAYYACMRVSVVGTTISAPPPACELRATNDEMLCTPRQALNNNTLWSTQQISLRTEELTSESKKIEIFIETYNKCNNDKDKVINNTALDLYADFSAITIKGITNLGKDKMVNVSQANIDKDNVVFNQIYTIVNNGFTWNNLTALIIVQKREYLSIEKEITIKGELVAKEEGDSPQTCTQVPGTNSAELTYSCDIGSLSRQKPTKIVTIQMSVKNVNLESIIEQKENDVYSELILQVNGADPETTPKALRIESILGLEAEIKVPWWVILIAVIMGLLVVLILVFILKEVGFFRRDGKQKLKNVERSVKRQTVIRRSMMERSPPAPNQLLTAEEDTEEAAAAATAVAHKPRPETRVKVFPE